MKKLNLSIIALAITVITVSSSIIIAQVGQVSDFYAYKSCTDDSECDEDGSCFKGKH